jgi:hypothetical protein
MPAVEPLYRNAPKAPGTTLIMKWNGTLNYQALWRLTKSYGSIRWQNG